MAELPYTYKYLDFWLRTPLSHPNKSLQKEFLELNHNTGTYIQLFEWKIAIFCESGQ